MGLAQEVGGDLGAPGLQVFRGVTSTTFDGGGIRHRVVWVSCRRFHPVWSQQLRKFEVTSGLQTCKRALGHRTGEVRVRLHVDWASCGRLHPVWSFSHGTGSDRSLLVLSCPGVVFTNSLEDTFSWVRMRFHRYMRHPVLGSILSGLNPRAQEVTSDLWALYCQVWTQYL